MFCSSGIGINNAGKVSKSCQDSIAGQKQSYHVRKFPSIFRLGWGAIVARPCKLNALARAQPSNQWLEPNDFSSAGIQEGTPTMNNHLSYGGDVGVGVLFLSAEVFMTPTSMIKLINGTLGPKASLELKTELSGYSAGYLYDLLAFLTSMAYSCRA